MAVFVFYPCSWRKQINSVTEAARIAYRNEQSTMNIFFRVLGEADK